MKKVTLDELLERSDYVVPLVIYTPENTNMLGDKQLRRMKKTAWLVNCSRGDIVDEAALEKVLQEKAIAGFATDVGMATDQMPSPHLAKRRDALATPHVGGITKEFFELHATQTVQQTAEILAGRIPSGALNAEHATRIARLRSK